MELTQPLPSAAGTGQSVNMQWDMRGRLLAPVQELSGSWHEMRTAGTPGCAEALMILTLVSSFPAPTLAPLAALEMRKDCVALNKPELWVQEGGC